MILSSHVGDGHDSASLGLRVKAYDNPGNNTVTGKFRLGENGNAHVIATVAVTLLLTANVLAQDRCEGDGEGRGSWKGSRHRLAVAHGVVGSLRSPFHTEMRSRTISRLLRGANDFAESVSSSWNGGVPRQSSLCREADRSVLRAKSRIAAAPFDNLEK